MHLVYILHSKKLDRFYTGYTSDFDLRLTFHESGDVGKFTVRAKDWELFLKIPCLSKSQALAIENHIKRMKSSTYIRNLKRYPEIIERLRRKY